MFIELTLFQPKPKKVLVNSKHIVGVIDSRKDSDNFCHLIMRVEPNLDINESFEEVKKRLGLSIIPRYETIVAT